VASQLVRRKDHTWDNNMRTSIIIKNIIAIFILAIVGSVFAFKYSARISGSINLTYLIAALYAIGYIAVVTILWRFDLTQYSWAGNRRLLFAVLAILSLGAMAVVTMVSDSSRVTRFSAITEWIELLLAGKFPWGVQTQFNPSGMPFLFILALPFYYAGNIGYMEVAGVILFCIALVKFYTQPHTRWLPLLALALLPSFYYELLVRSELFFNMLLIILLIALSEGYLDAGKLNIWFFSLAMLFGFGLSTRTIVGLIYAGYFAYKFRGQIWHGILFSGLTLIAFGLTLIPFMFWDAPKFLREGPFSVQMGYLPVGMAALFAAIAAVVGWNVSSIRDVLFSEGILLFVIVVIAFLSPVTQLGIYATVIKDRFDITYFIFCTPFLLLSLERPS